MSERYHGYESSLGYGFGYGREMAPVWLRFCARLAGYAPPERAAPDVFRYLELGCGQGFGLCLLAAATPRAEFLGVDLMPEHIAHAEELAAAAGLENVRFRQADFLDLALVWPEDFGTFDYVTLHGIYSWVSPAVRDAVVQCLHHATHTGSLVYNAYNTQPGWLSTMPFQHITSLLRETTGQPAGEVFADSIGLFERLGSAGAAPFQFLPGLKARLASVKDRNVEYLTHEYLHENWHPLWHSQVAKDLARAELSYVGPATIAESLLPAVLPKTLRDAVLGPQDQRLRQDLQDFAVNQSFRRDIFCRGPAANLTQRIEMIADTPIHLVAMPADGKLAFNAVFGDIALDRPAFAGIVDALASGPRTIAELAARPGLREQGLSNLLQILILLLHAGTLAIGVDQQISGDTAERLNRVIVRAASEGVRYDHLAAAGIGSAVPTSETELKVLGAWFERSEGSDALLRWRQLGVVL